MNHSSGSSWRLLVAAAAALLLLVTGCGQTNESRAEDSATTTEVGEDLGREVVEEDPAQYGGRLVVGVRSETDGWNPQFNNFTDSGALVIASVVEALASVDDEGQVVPWLAQSWESNEDATVWTVTLRPGITFHDGEPLDAAAAKVNIDSSVGSPLRGLVLGPRVEEVVVVDDLTFEIHTTEPWSDLPGSMLALQPGMMVSPKMIETESGGARAPIGTGPFEFEEWVVGDHFTALRNADYWRATETGDALPYLDEIEFRVIADASAQALALQSGDVDMVLTAAPSAITQLRTGDFQLIEDNFSQETFVMFNEAAPPFDNEHARRAVAYATNPDVLVTSLGEGITTPVRSLWQEHEPWFTEDDGYVTFDPQKAKEEAAAYEAEAGQPLSFVFKGFDNVDDVRLQHLLVEMWGEAGISAEVETVEQTDFIADIALGDFEAGLRNFSITHPGSEYTSLHSDYSQEPGELSVNFSRTTLDELDGALEAARSASDDQERVERYGDVTRILNGELPFVWLYNTPYAIAAREEVHGLNPPREQGFADFGLKSWVGELWLDQ